MNIKTIAQTSARHANQFTANCLLFQAEENGRKVEVIVEQQGNNKSLGIYLNGERITASSNYPKAIGLAILILNQ